MTQTTWDDWNSVVFLSISSIPGYVIKDQNFFPEPPLVYWKVCQANTANPGSSFIHLNISELSVGFVKCNAIFFKGETGLTLLNFFLVMCSLDQFFGCYFVWVQPGQEKCHRCGTALDEKYYLRLSLWLSYTCKIIQNLCKLKLKYIYPNRWKSSSGCLQTKTKRVL